MSILGSIAHALGANGYVKASDGNRYSFSNTPEGVYRVPGTIIDPPGSGRARPAFFTTSSSASAAATATATPGTRVVNTRPGA